MAKLPLYLEIAEKLRQDMASGTVAVGERLGSQREFCQRFRVSAITVEWALRVLEKEGLITRKRGRGTFVAQRTRATPAVRIGVVGHVKTDWETNVYARTLFNAIQLQALEHGCLIRYDEREADYADLLDRSEVDGLLIIAPFQPNLHPLRQLNSERHHYVVVGADWGVSPSVSVDNRKGIYEALKHLAGLGHRHIAILTDSVRSQDAAQRWQAYLDFHAERGWMIMPHWVAHLEDWSISDPVLENRLFERFFGGDQRPTALLALGSNYAEDMIRVVRKHGLRVPEDVSIVGFDLPPSNPRLQRDLTAILQPIERMGRESLDLLIKRIQGRRIKVHTVLEPVLRVGITTGKAAGRARETGAKA
jgi:GntR family transcriptional regulator of arabinose operon